MLDQITLLEKLAQLRRSGVLTPEEYQSEKSRVLASIAGAESAGIEEGESEEPLSYASENGAGDNWGRLGWAGAAVVGAIFAGGAIYTFTGGSPILAPDWADMDSTTLRGELKRAAFTGSQRYLSCFRDGDEASCEEVGPIFEDAAEMAAILCEREPGAKECDDKDTYSKTASMPKLIEDFSNAVAEPMDNLGSYTPR